MYFAVTVSTDTYHGLDKYFQMDGLAYQIVPIESNRIGGRYGSVDTEIMYKNLMEDYRFRSIDNPSVYINENSNSIISNYRNIFGRLARALVDENKNKKAIAALDRCMEVIPPETVPFNFFALSLIEQYYKANDIEKGVKYSRIFMEQCAEELSFLLSLPQKYSKNVKRETELNLYILNELFVMASSYENDEHKDELEDIFNLIGMRR